MHIADTAILQLNEKAIAPLLRYEELVPAMKATLIEFSEGVVSRGAALGNNYVKLSLNRWVTIDGQVLVRRASVAD